MCRYAVTGVNGGLPMRPVKQQGVGVCFTTRGRTTCLRLLKHSIDLWGKPQDC